MGMRADESGFLDVRLLGPVELVAGGQLVPLQPALRILLAMLALRPGQLVTVGALVEALWGGAGGDRKRNLHAHVYQLRRRLDEAAPSRAGSLLVTREPGYLLTLADEETDLARFCALAEQGRRQAAAGDPAGAARTLSEALALWRGASLADVAALSDAMAEQAAILDELRIAAVEDRLQADLDCGGHAAVTAELAGLAAAYPLRERIACLHMLALYRAGRNGEALAAYQHARIALVGELGIEPGPELRAIQQRILDADQSLLHASQQAASGVAKPVAEPAARPALAAVTVPRQLPAVTRHFAGRHDELKRLNETLDAARPGGTVLITALGGAGGIGKTALALHWAHQIAGQFPDGQLYLNMRGFDPAAPPVSPAEAVRELLDGLGVPSLPGGLDAQTALYRTMLADRHMLIVLDNARDAAQVRPLLPASPASLVLVTSRNTLVGLAATDGAVQIPLGLLSAAEAGQVLAARLGPERLAAEPAAVDQLAEACAGLPLALSVVAARAAAQPDLLLAELAASMRTASSRLDALDAGDPAASVRDVFSWSYQQLSTPAARMFRLLSLHPGADIAVQAAASIVAVSPAAARRQLAELVRASLLSERVPGRYAYHDLLRAYAAEAAAAEPDSERLPAIRRCLDYYLHTGHAAQQHFDQRLAALVTPAEAAPGTSPDRPADRKEAHAWFTVEFEALARCAELAASTGLDQLAWQLAWAAREYVFVTARLDQASRLGHIALAAAGRLHDDAGAGLAEYLLARAAHWRALDGHSGGVLEGRDLASDSPLLDEAAEHAGRALDHLTLAGDLLSQGYCNLQLSQIRYEQGRLSQAIDAADAAMAQMTAGGYQDGRGYALVYQGAWAHLAGQQQRGIALLTEAAQMFGDLHRPDMLAAVHENFAECLWRQGELGAAQEHAGQALELYRQLGSEIRAAEVLALIGGLREAAGQPAGARAAWQEALDLIGDRHYYLAALLRDRLCQPGQAGPLA